MITGLVIGPRHVLKLGFVLLLPLVFPLNQQHHLDYPVGNVSVPMVAALSVTHCFLPPHPGPTAIATIFGANLGTTFTVWILSLPFRQLLSQDRCFF